MNCRTFVAFATKTLETTKKKEGRGKNRSSNTQAMVEYICQDFVFFFCFYIFSKNLSTLLDGERKCYCKRSISKLIVYLARCRAEALWHQGREKKEKQKGEEQGHSR